MWDKLSDNYIKPCVHCKWYTEIEECQHTKAFLVKKINYVTGEVKPSKQEYCATMRMDIGECKPKGLLFERKGTDE